MKKLFNLDDNFKKIGAGFTIIELLIVVAIIAVLTGIVLANVTGYINASKDSAIKANLSTILSNGSVFYDDNNTFAGFCSDTKYTTPEAAIDAIGGVIQSCNVNGGTVWCACATLKVTEGDVFCVDSTGYKKETANDCATACSATGACM